MLPDTRLHVGRVLLRVSPPVEAGDHPNVDRYEGVNKLYMDDNIRIRISQEMEPLLSIWSLLPTIPPYHNLPLSP
jgi:hypothetical protein